MSFTCSNAPNIKYNTLEKLKLNSTLELITTEEMLRKKIKERLKQRENFWILTPKGLNQKLN